MRRIGSRRSAVAFVENLEKRQLLSARISITGNSVPIGSNDTTLSRTDFTDYGPTPVSGTTTQVTRTYTIRNSGTSTLRFNGKRVAVMFAAESNFFISQRPPATIAPGGTATFRVTFDPSSAGNKVHEVRISSNAANRLNFRLIVGGTGHNTTNLADGLQVATTQTGTGPQATNGMVLRMNYTGFLLNGTVFDSSLNPGRTPFAFALGASEVIQGWDRGLLNSRVGDKKILFIPPALGYGAGGQGSIPGNSTLIFETEALGIGPSIGVNGLNDRAITDGDASPSTSDGTDFGTRTINTNLDRSFRVFADIASNSVGPNFTATPRVRVAGANAADFTITQQPDNTNQFTFIVRFRPSAAGTRVARIEIPNNNPIDPTFNFELRGTGAVSLQGRNANPDVGTNAAVRPTPFSAIPVRRDRDWFELV